MELHSLLFEYESPFFANLLIYQKSTTATTFVEATEVVVKPILTMRPCRAICLPQAPPL
jgi:hypothetical protein